MANNLNQENEDKKDLEQKETKKKSTTKAKTTTTKSTTTQKKQPAKKSTTKTVASRQAKPKSTNTATKKTTNTTAKKGTTTKKASSKIIDKPPISISNVITTAPNGVIWTDISITVKPVTQTADVTIKSESTNPKLLPLVEDIGKAIRPVPIKITPKNVNIINT